MTRSCIFCDINQGKRPGYIVFEDDISVAFLDIRPLFPGHVLLTPREHYETLPDVPSRLLGPLFTNAQRLSVAVRDACGAQGTFVAMNNKVSQSVPHLHIHVVPRSKKDGLRGFFWPRNPYDDDNHMVEVQTKIREALKGN